MATKKKTVRQESQTGIYGKKKEADESPRGVRPPKKKKRGRR